MASEHWQKNHQESVHGDAVFSPASRRPENDVYPETLQKNMIEDLCRSYLIATRNLIRELLQSRLIDTEIRFYSSPKHRVP